MDKERYNSLYLEVILSIPRPQLDEFLLETIAIKKVKCPQCQSTTAHFVKVQESDEAFKSAMAEDMECASCESTGMNAPDSMVWH